MGNFFAELKRRHIYRVAAAYAVVAWLLLQLYNNVAPIYELPLWVGRAFVFVLVAGFPVALLFCLIQQFRQPGSSPKTNRLDGALVAALILVASIFAYQQLSTSRNDETATE